MKEEVALRFRVSPRHQVGLTVIGIAFACLWYLDVLTTMWALAWGAIELGPVAKFLMSKGIWGLLVGRP